jgi:predicted SprT family Zn-dependent metalloprotease
MDTDKAMSLARALCDEHGIHVPIEWHNRKCSAGTTHFLGGQCTRIALSRPITVLNSEEQVRDTILHEIAHVKAGLKAGHGRMWKLTAMLIGARPEPCCSDGTVLPTGRYYAVCPVCAQELNKYRKPRAGSRYICADCNRKGIKSFVEVRERIK